MQLVKLELELEKVCQVMKDDGTQCTNKAVCCFAHSNGKPMIDTAMCEEHKQAALSNSLLDVKGLKKQ